MGDRVVDVLKFLIGGLVLSAVVAAPIGCTVHRDRQIAEMVKAGADPMQAGCAISVGIDNRQMCINAALRSAK